MYLSFKKRKAQSIYLIFQYFCLQHVASVQCNIICKFATHIIDTVIGWSIYLEIYYMFFQIQVIENDYNFIKTNSIFYLIKNDIKNTTIVEANIVRCVFVRCCNTNIMFLNIAYNLYNFQKSLTEYNEFWMQYFSIQFKHKNFKSLTPENKHNFFLENGQYKRAHCEENIEECYQVIEGTVMFRGKKNCLFRSKYY